ncbi:roadblock/LC7 domain-containing protein [Streptomyces hesseae]|uniref:Roadblock/LC7 domain-containing protein n=1 Tax=Streptomyces hesseae TaxID=3075519 RepID=A0ABU2SSY6_9ACTN|nr:roadblock/LC7 domain-containing protein [Streptomyces sp. DSM 40473]MDT0451034.1 roadblock/LC7 domain-containing protein [Streptomyces sp. DSM 40473]
MGFGKELDSMLDELAEGGGGIRHALVLSNDGLVTGASAGLVREEAEHLAAVASGLHSLARGTGRQFRVGGVRQTMVEFDRGVLFVTAADEESCLCVLGDADADIGRIAYEMTLLANRVGGRSR